MRNKLLELDQVFLDTETTGLDPEKDEIIEIAIIRRSYKGDITNTFCRMVKPSNTEKALESSKINGYSPEAWSGSHPFSVISSQVADLLKNCVIYGHNIRFDMDFILGEMKGCDTKHNISHHTMDTRVLAYEYLVPRGLESLSLKSILQFYGIDTTGSHSALVDARNCMMVHDRIMKDHPAKKHRSLMESIKGWITL